MLCIFFGCEIIAMGANFPCQFAMYAILPCQFAMDAILPCQFAMDAILPCQFAMDANLPCQFAMDVNKPSIGDISPLAGAGMAVERQLSMCCAIDLQGRQNSL